MDRPKLTEIIDPKLLQKIQDAFSEYTGMASAITDGNGVMLTSSSGFTPFCSKLVRSTEAGRKGCERCIREGAAMCIEKGRTTAYDCHAGLRDFAAPLIAEGQVLGCFICGQIRVKEPDEDTLRRTAEIIGIEPDLFINGVKEINLISAEKAEKAAVFLGKLAAVISDIAYIGFSDVKNSRMTEMNARSRSEYMAAVYSDLEYDLIRIADKAKNALASEDAAQKEQVLTDVLGASDSRLSYLRDTLGYINRFKGQLTTIDAPYEVRETISYMADRSGAENHMTLSFSDSLPDYLFGDTERLGNLLDILISSADICTDDGTLDIRVYGEEKEYALMLCISVTDGNTACGSCSCDDIPSYARTRGDTEIKTDLTGADIILRQLGGSFSIRSVSGRGSTVTVKIPQLAANKE